MENSYICDKIDTNKVHCGSIANSNNKKQYLCERIFNQKKPKLKKIYQLMKGLLKEKFRNKSDQAQGDSTYVEVSDSIQISF